MKQAVLYQDIPILPEEIFRTVRAIGFDLVLNVITEYYFRKLGL
jgi:hypothetical protein